MTKFFTGKGDDGTTGLIGEGRVSKADLRFETIGTLDELSAFIGNAKCLIEDKKISIILEAVQRDLNLIMSELAIVKSSENAGKGLDENRVLFIEQVLDEIGSITEMPKEFILPGETHEAVAFGICRVVARRAERRIVGFTQQSGIHNPQLLRYLNRLSSLFFLLEVKYSTKNSSQKFRYAKVQS
jgi:cob(I)alamin adenosyltransferase